MESQTDYFSIPNGGYAVKAIYIEQFLSEYSGNPLIEALPPIYSKEEFVGLVAVYPNFNPDERKLDARFRFHCVERLNTYFQPFDRHIDLEQRISRILRQGYLARNPLGPEYATRLRQIHQAIKQGGGQYQLANCVNVKSSASGLTVIGLSGGGKSTAINTILTTYPQVILHSDFKGINLSIYQVVWLKLDCPHAGSLKGLCIDFFLAIDRLLGTNYFSKFGSTRNSEDTMLAQMAQIASRQCLGVLVIDEIQNLSTAKSGGSEKMLSFFVKLANIIGVPVVRIGTNKALPILQGDFRQARRGVGEGGMIWERMKSDEPHSWEEWDFFIEIMFDYQWTKHKTNLTKELNEALYDESQGIVDIAIKLYMMAQWRAIALNTDIITSELIRRVADDSLHLVKPMLDALKSGDAAQVARYGDISPIDTMGSYKQYLSKLQSREQVQQARVVKKQSITDTGAALNQVILELVQLDVEPAVANKYAKAVLYKRAGDETVSSLVTEAYKLALQDGQGKNSNINDVSKTKSRKTKAKPEVHPNDLRSITEEGIERAVSGYEAMKARGIIQQPTKRFLNLG